jgi:phosphohistidine phosphatase
MNLYLLRHGIAVERGALGYETDAKRPLTDRGRRRMRRAAEGMRRLKLGIEQVISSPAVRALQTAQIVVEVLGCSERFTTSAHLAVDADPQPLIAQLQERFAGCRGVLLVGHEPYLSNLGAKLVSGRAHLPLLLKKGGLCKLAIVGSLHYGPCAHLEWLLAPAHLRRMA